VLVKQIRAAGSAATAAAAAAAPASVPWYGALKNKKNINAIKFKQ